MKRREFVRHSAVAAAGLGLVGNSDLRHGVLSASTFGAGIAQDREAMAMAALNAAQMAGADYADIRISTNRTQRMSTREAIVTGVRDSETSGFGIRVLVDGTWGFAASRDVSTDEVARVAQVAVAQARANRAAQRRPVELAPLDWTGRGEWRSPVEIEPFDIPIEDKVALLLEANQAAMSVSGIAFASSNMSFLREEKFFASTEGVITDQTIYKAAGGVNTTAVSADRSDFQSRSSTDVMPKGVGYEHILASDLVGNAPRWAEDAVQKLSATPVQPGRYDLVLRPSHLWLTIHEAIAHPTELDRIMGFEANYAGTSFISNPEDFLGSFRYGPDIMNIQGERSTPGALSTVGWDDEGVKPEEYLIVKDGILNDLQTTREQAPWLSDWYASQGKPMRSHGNSYGQSWEVTQFQRMPNVNLMPHPERDVSEEELIDGVENGILIDGSGSFSIDQQRYNAQFGGQTYYEIKNGEITGMLKDVAYQIRTPEFWNAMDLIGGESTYLMAGAFGDAKGQPAQSNSISHGCPTTRHRDITIINTGRRA
ncbi:MAG: TldD/PmbA family protein [Gemmatimonadales bacterium]|jgi:TldD protein|nr:TldD/PmbA family protein [Gemmatimonadales bacterium]MDG2241705.1 TldD/PmbA family protein [Longimicrobiales bacterium]MBT3498594.1 TldD/PmbA family protein [Gemmatimonadales bacterium]MBT3958671.1 TldD/PmbA family protein [Gemmatimonadales bacterium]MBT4438586.1 TldD/PmbA family protein [Gemmatimonadales bacterium]